jgi:Protein of unknown function (DUF2510)
MTVDSGWYPDQQGVVRFWDGQQWGPPAPTSSPAGRIGVAGLIVAAIGAALVVISFAAVSWINTPEVESGATIRLRFSQFDDPAITGFSSAYFTWLGWAVFALAVILSVGAALPSSSRAVFMSLGVIAGVAGFLVTLAALGVLSHQAHISFSDFVSDFGAGPWLAGVGFLVLAAGAGLGRTGTTPA